MTNQSTIDKEVKKKSRKKPEVKIYKISILILERIIVLKEVLRWI